MLLIRQLSAVQSTVDNTYTSPSSSMVCHLYLSPWQYSSSAVPRPLYPIGLWYVSIRTYSRYSRQCHHWEEVLVDLWRSFEGVSDFCVSYAVLLCVQTLPLPTARRDSQCAGNDRGHSWEVVRSGGGVYAGTKIVLSNHQNFWCRSTILNCFTSNVVTKKFSILCADCLLVVWIVYLLCSFVGLILGCRCIIVFLLMLKLHSIGFALFNLAILNFGSYTSLAHKSTYS